MMVEFDSERATLGPDGAPPPYLVVELLQKEDKNHSLHWDIGFL